MVSEDFNMIIQEHKIMHRQTYTTEISFVYIICCFEFIDSENLTCIFQCLDDTIRVAVPRNATIRLLVMFNESEICDHLFTCFQEYLTDQLKKHNIFSSIVIGSLMSSSIKRTFKNASIMHKM